MVRSSAGGHGRHAAARQFNRRHWLLLIVGVLVVAAGAVTAFILSRPGSTGPDHHPRTAAVPPAQAGSGGSTAAVACRQRVRVVAASSYAPVLRQVAAGLTDGADCVDVQLRVADGRAAAGVVASTRPDVWIADDASWTQLPSSVRLADGHAILATSPLYFVTTKSAPQLPDGARSWLGLAHRLDKATSGSRLLVADPADSGDGMVAAAGLADAVFNADGPLVSALDLMRAAEYGATADSAVAALPTKPDQVAVLPEYALLRSGHADQYRTYAPTDGTVLMRYSWLPTDGADDATTRAAVQRLRQALTGPDAATALASADLRAGHWPATAPPSAAEAGFPSPTAQAMPVSSEHIMYHVLSTYRPALRRSNMLIVSDVSGSMGEDAAGSSSAKIALVRDGVGEVAKLLPDSATLGLWRFGSQLDPPHDWQTVVRPAPLGRTQRAALTAAASTLRARRTGTGLYDTILAAYRYQQDHYVSAEPNQVLIFTDGVNEDDPAGINLAQLKAGLAATDRGRPVELSVFGFSGATPLPTAALGDALAPVDGQVDELATPDQVTGAFVHAVSGALSGMPARP
jgi:hypothetical protein